MNKQSLRSMDLKGLLGLILNSKYLLLITLLGAFFRFYNLNWDQGLLFHPDERNIANAVTKINFFTDLNPQFFAYGGLTVYLYRILADLIQLITADISWTTDWGKINLIGRYFSALFSTLTIPLIYLLGKKLFSKEVGLISSLLFTLTTGVIQVAHFATTESLLIFFITLITYLSLNTSNKPGLKSFIYLGIICGLSIAAKTTAISFLIVPLTTLALLTVYKQINLKQSLFYLFSLLVFTFLLFTLFSPYTFLSWDKFQESMNYETGVATGTLPVPYTLQFTNTPAYLYQLYNLIWQIGPIASLAVAGWLVLLVNAIITKRSALIIFLIFPLIYFLYIGHWHTKFIRYMTPLLPFLVISPSYLIYLIYSHHKLLGRILLLISLTLTLFWAIAYLSIYQKGQTRIQASMWIYANIPNNSYLLKEHWDDGLPLPLDNAHPSIYRIDELTLYDSDNYAKSVKLANQLSQADYILINSRRLYGTFINLTDKYPLTSRYYQLLFSGQLGYQKVVEISSYPNIFGLTFNDDLSEETFQVYDHPKVLIFKNTKVLDNIQILQKLLL